MATRAINTVLNLRDMFTAPMRRAADSARNNSREMKLLGNNVRGFQAQAVSSFTNVAKKAVGLGVSLAGIGTAAAGMYKVVNFAKEYGTSMSKLQAQTGVTKAELKGMDKEITALYKGNFGDSWTDLSDAMAITKQVTKQAGSELSSTTKNAVMYRDVFGEDIAESIKAVDTMMRNFGITSDQAYNLLAQGAQKGLNKSGELIDSANEYAPYFAKLGFNAEQMFDTFSAGLEAGAFNLDKVGDGIKEFGIRTKDGSKGSMEAYQAIGLSGEKMTAQFAEGGVAAQKAFLTTVKAINSVKSPAERNAAAVALFGTQAEDLEDRVIKAYGNVSKQFDMTKDTMGDVANMKFDNVGDAFRGIGRNLEIGLVKPLAEKMLPKINEFGSWIGSNMPKIQNEIQYAFNLGGKAIDGFKNSLKWAKDNANWLIPVVAGLTGAIVAQKVVGTVSGLFSAWKTVTQGLTIAQAALTLVMNMSPFGWIATAIGLVIAGGIALYQNWDTVKAKASELWEWLGNAWTNIKEATVNTFSGMGESIKGAFGSVVGFVKTPINTVIGMINNMINKINSISFTVPDWVPGMGGETYGIDIPNIPQFALGTSYFSGGMAQINERGGEIVNLPNGSQVIPAARSERMMSNMSGGITVQIIVQGDLIGEEEHVNRIMNKAVPKLLAALGNA